jgi:two-component system response regulator PilR (NtrC family)
MEKTVEGLEPETLRLLESYDWPGNVRELENTIERAVALETGGRITPAVLPEKLLRDARGIVADISAGELVPAEGLDLEARIAEIEKAYLRAALARAGGVGTRAAELLRVTYRSFKHYSKKYEL